MATQGILSIVHDGRVLNKLVCGCNGQNVPQLATFLKEVYTSDELLKLDVSELNKYAQGQKVGCEDCLVVMSENNLPNKFDIEYDGEIEDLADDYWGKYNDPRWNPRWDRGTADHVEVLEI